MPARARSLPADVVGLLLSGSGVLTVRAAVAAGVSAERVHRLARAGLLERVGDGAYASSQQLVEANPWVAHAIRTRGFVQSRRKPSLAAGWSAVAVRRLPALRAVPPALPTAVQLDPVRRGTDTTPYGVVRLHDLDEIHHAQYAGCPTVGRAWLAVDLARAAPRPDALVVADAVLHGGTTVGGLRRALAHMTGWPGTDAAAWVVEHADGGAESPLESLGRLAFIEYGLPVPLSNVWVGNGWPEYRVDHLWPYTGWPARRTGLASTGPPTIRSGWSPARRTARHTCAVCSAWMWGDTAGHWLWTGPGSVRTSPRSWPPTRPEPSRCSGGRTASDGADTPASLIILWEQRRNRPPFVKNDQ
jgi:hypothetical protein